VVLLGIDVERLAVLHRRARDGLPSRAEDAAQQDIDVVLLHQLGGLGGRLLVVGRAVIEDQPEEAVAELQAAA